MSQRRCAGDYVLIQSIGTAIPQLAHIQDTEQTEPCFACEDGACQVWPVRLQHPSGRWTMTSRSECVMTTATKKLVDTCAHA